MAEASSSTLESSALKEKYAPASSYSAVTPPRGFRPGPFPFHYHLNIVIDTLGELGWGRGHLAEGDDQEISIGTPVGEGGYVAPVPLL